MTTVARTLFDLAGALHPGRTERALDNALSRHLLTLEAVRETTIELRQHGRSGSSLMRRLLRLSPPGGGRPGARTVSAGGRDGGGRAGRRRPGRRDGGG